METLTRVPITFDGANGRPQHAPLVIGRVGGLNTRLVLDTGSDVHLLTKELVDQLGLAFEEGEEGVDHSGATMPSWSVEDVGLRLGDHELTLSEVVAIPAPAPFGDLGIGGILSPHRLLEASAVIDLVRNEFVLVDAMDAELAAWLAKRAPALTLLDLARDERFAMVVVGAAIKPHPDHPAVLNTGGGDTEFSSAAVPGRHRASDERTGAGLSGTDVIGANVGAATLVVGDHELGVESLVIRGEMHGPQGLIGMDVLRGTVLAVSAARSSSVLWQLDAA